MKLILLEKKHETSEVVSFIFKPQEPFTWQSGQFLKYSLGEDKYFSIASSPKEKIVMLTTKFSQDEKSLFKQKLLKLEIGDSIDSNGPYGKFVIDDPNLNYVFIAGGIGITSFRSIILDLNLRKKPINVTLLYASKNEDVVYKHELEEIALLHPEFRINYFIGENKLDPSSLKPLVAKTSLFYISGPERLVESFEEILLNLGINLHQIKRDYFSGYNTL